MLNRGFLRRLCRNWENLRSGQSHSWNTGFVPGPGSLRSDRARGTCDRSIRVDSAWNSPGRKTTPSICRFRIPAKYASGSVNVRTTLEGIRHLPERDCYAKITPLPRSWVDLHQLPIPLPSTLRGAGVSSSGTTLIARLMPGAEHRRCKERDGERRSGALNSRHVERDLLLLYLSEPRDQGFGDRNTPSMLVVEKRALSSLRVFPNWNTP